MSEPSPPEELSDELVEGIRHLKNHQLTTLIQYVEALLADRTRPISEAIRETEDMDTILHLEERDGYAVVKRKSEDNGPPRLFHVRREHYPDGSVDLRWVLIGRVAEE